MPLLDLVVIVSAALLSAGSAVLFLRQPTRTVGFQPEVDGQTLLFEDNVLYHASDDATERFSMETGADEWEDLRDKVVDTFPDFPVRPAAPTHGDTRLQAAAAAEHSEVVIKWRGVMTHVAFREKEAEDAGTSHPDGIAELDMLRHVNASVPHPVWKIDAAGDVVWSNPAYEDLFLKARGIPATGNDPLFGSIDLAQLPPEGHRASLPISGTKALDWFNITRADTPNGAVFHASTMNAVVKAEEAQRNFVQTLAKTFAHLSIGLAIFDKNRQLALFNPALIDLTNLPAEFLSARPTMESFFDRLRENRRMPEPKNYRNWRQEIAEVIAAASDGRYQETWSLESGQTYKVRGRPHPDGATAFLIEDISAEVSLTRNFRAELELAQCLLDTVDDGLAVFSQSGILTFCNVNYQELWNLDTESSFVDFTIRDSITAWKERSTPNPLWQDIEDFVLSYGDRRSFDIPVQPKGRAPMACQVVPIISGATLIRFCKVSALQNVPVAVKSLKE